MTPNPDQPFIRNVVRRHDRNTGKTTIYCDGTPMPGLVMRNVQILIDATGKYKDLYAADFRIAGVRFRLDPFRLSDVYESDSVQEGDKNE